jgi:hypothetical protein
MTALSDLLVETNAGERSARALALEARERGYTLNHDTAARYLRGDHGAPDEATLVAFADILQIPLRKLRQAAGLPDELTAPYEPPAESSRLTRRQRKAVDEIIRAMLDTRASAGSARGTVTRMPRTRRTTGSRAARHGTPEPPER